MKDYIREEDFTFTSESLKNLGFDALAKVLEFVEWNGAIDSLIVLGSGVENKKGIKPKNISKMNAFAAICLKSLGLVNEVILTGGRSLDELLPAESEVMINYLKRLGVPHLDEFIKLENSSLTTIQNAQNSIDFWRNKETIGLIGSPHHMPRAKVFVEEVLTSEYQCLDISINSNEVLKEFLQLYNHFVERGSPENTLLTELGYLKEIMEYILKDFESLSLFDDGGAVLQFAVRQAYKIPVVRDYLEEKGQSRGKHNTRYNIEL